MTTKEQDPHIQLRERINAVDVAMEERAKAVAHQPDLAKQGAVEAMRAELEALVDQSLNIFRKHQASVEARHAEVCEATAEAEDRARVKLEPVFHELDIDLDLPLEQCISAVPAVFDLRGRQEALRGRREKWRTLVHHLECERLRDHPWRQAVYKLVRYTEKIEYDVNVLLNDEREDSAS